jgi:signal transduction histidine kinase
METIVQRVRQITRDNERLFQELIAGERRFRHLARAVWRVQEEERRRLARDLHDGLGQTLTALKNQLEILGQEAADALSPALAERLADSVELAAQSVQETRELSRLLRPQILDDLGLDPALRWLTRTVGQRTGLSVELVTAGLEGALDSELETLAFRIVQEALNNVVKHGGEEAEATVDLRLAEGHLTLEVRDTGHGFDPSAVLPGDHDSSGSGLRGMRDRAELFAGRMELDSRPGEGTRVRVVIPLREVEP